MKSENSNGTKENGFGEMDAKTSTPELQENEELSQDSETGDSPGQSVETEAADESEEIPASSVKSFQEMDLKEEVLKGIAALGFENAMEVQSVTYPLIIEGNDLMVQSRTGSGKTAAFGIPFAQEVVDPEIRKVQALVLCPTRELAKQVALELETISKYRGLEVLAVYGGAPLGPQISAFKKGVHIVAGTPGRVLDHLKRKTLETDEISVLVLDECDEMLSMGFQEDIYEIISFLPEDRQTLLFSATINEDVERLAQKFMSEPEKISLSEDYIGVKEISHYYYLSTAPARHQEFLRILENEKPGSAIIFCNTRDDTNVISRFLKKKGYKAEAISSDLSQAEREKVLGKMRTGKIQFLVATDLAARGIDIQDLTHVFNYSFPDSSETYVHRTGRTGRAGKTGTAVSLIAPQDLGNFYYMKLTYGIEPEEKRMPSEQELITRRESRIFRKLKDRFSSVPSSEHISLVRRFLHDGTGEIVLANILKEFLDTNKSRGYRDDSSSSRTKRMPGRNERDRNEGVGRHGAAGDDRKRSDSGSHSKAGEGRDVKLYVNMGRRDNIKAKTLKDMLADLSGVDEESLQRIRVRETHTYIHVSRDIADMIIAKANGKRVQEKSLVVEPAKR